MNKFRSKESEEIIKGVPSCEAVIAVCGGVGEEVVEKYIEYDWDGNPKKLKVKLLGKMDLSYIAPHSSNGILMQDLSKSDLRGSDFEYSLFEDCDFDNTNLSGVNLRGSYFKNCSFKKSIMKDVKTNKKTKVIDCDLRGVLW